MFVFSDEPETEAYFSAGARVDQASSVPVGASLPMSADFCLLRGERGFSSQASTRKIEQGAVL